MMEIAGTIIMKIFPIVLLSILFVVQLIAFGDVLKGLIIFFYDIDAHSIKENEEWLLYLIK